MIRTSRLERGILKDEHTELVKRRGRNLTDGPIDRHTDATPANNRTHTHPELEHYGRRAPLPSSGVKPNR